MQYTSSVATEVISLISSANPELISAVYVSLVTSAIALVLASCCALPLSVYLAFSQSYYSKTITFLVDTLLAMPTVLIGLIGYLLFSQQGLFASLHLLYTISAIGIMLAVLAFPLLTSLITHTIKRVDYSTRDTVLTLGASKLQMVCTILWEGRNGIAISYITTLTRVISEVGIAMIVGGNIRYHTRTITTTIALETGKGNFILGLSLGVILLLLAIIFNTCVRLLQKREQPCSTN